MPNENMTFKVENAQLIYKNFSGKETQFNDEGVRSFACLLEPEAAEKMAADGWNVKYTKPRNDEDVPVPFIPIALRFDVRPPHIVMITSTARTNIDEKTVGTLDWVDMKQVDLICRAYHYHIPGNPPGIKAYLKTMFVTIEEDELEAKYGLVEKAKPAEG